MYTEQVYLPLGVGLCECHPAWLHSAVQMLHTAFCSVQMCQPLAPKPMELGTSGIDHNSILKITLHLQVVFLSHVCIKRKANKLYFN